MDPVSRIAEAVLYEGYILWPYRRSAFKNQQRWTLGGLYPQAYCQSRDEGDRWIARTECLIEAQDGPATVSIYVRFLQVVRRDVVRCGPRGQEPVDELTVAGRRHLAWEEATEREVSARGLALAALDDAAEVAIEVPAGRDTQWLEDPPGHRAGAVVRSWRPLRGAVTIRSRQVADGVHLLRVEIRNTTPGDWDSRGDALPHIFASAHVVLRVPQGRFVSLTDPPARLRPLVDQCRNAGLWPVLVGAEGADDTVLSAPIVLPDHPQIAPESPGDLFDATEIDQLLALSVLALTDHERAEMRDSDPRARDILDRIEAMSPGEWMRLHGAIREFGPLEN